MTDESGTFSVSAEGTPPIRYEWSFGDGTAATGPTVTHAFPAPGSYVVSVTATNEYGSDTATMLLILSPGTAPPAEIYFRTADRNLRVYAVPRYEWDEAGRWAMLTRPIPKDYQMPLAPAPAYPQPGYNWVIEVCGKDKSARLVRIIAGRDVPVQCPGAR